MSHYLLKAAEAGDVAKVKELLDSGADINYHSQPKKGTGRTALCEAALKGKLEVVRLLIEQGADLNVQDGSMGFTALHWAADYGHEPIVEALVAAGADVNLASPANRLTPFMAAATRGNLPIVKLLLAAGANVNATTKDGRTALSLAEEKKRAEVVALLASLGAPGTTPLAMPPAIAWPNVPPMAEFVDFSAPEMVLRGFILAMHDWELAAPELFKEYARGSTTARPKLLAGMQAVFDIFCTPSDRSRGRSGSFSTPPEYDPGESLVAIDRINSRRAELTTRAKDGQTEYLYVLLKKQDRWLVDSKKYRHPGGEWNKWSL